MQDFKGGVKWYTEMKIPVFFPESDVVCIHCPLLREEFSGSYKRYFCKRTGEFIPAPLSMIGNNCPGIMEVENDTGEVKENTASAKSSEKSV